MSVGHTFGSPFGSCVAISIFDCVEYILNEFIKLAFRYGKSMSETDIDHKHRGGAKVFTHLQIFIKSQSVCRPVSPILVIMSWSFLYRTYRLLPLEGIVITAFSFHIATAGKAEEGRTGVGKQLCQVGTQSVATVFPGIWKQ